MVLTDIYQFLENEQYDLLIQKMNEELSKDDKNPMYYYYRFLAYNKDFSHMDFTNLVDEMDMNRSFDLENEYSYSIEYNFLKEISVEERRMFVYALRGCESKLLGLLEMKMNSSLFFTNKVLRLFSHYVVNLDKYISLSLTKKVLEKILLAGGFAEKRLYLEFVAISKYIENRLEVFEDSRFEVKDGTLIGVKPKTLAHVRIPEYVKRIDPYVFKNFIHLEDVEIPNGVEFIGENCFMGCDKLKKVVLPKTIKKVAFPLFSGCSSLEDLTMPLVYFYDGKYRYNLGHYFGKQKYEGALPIEQVLNAEGRKSMGIFYIPEALKRLEIKDDTLNFKEIEWYTFYNCKMLKEVILPRGLKAILQEAFNGCKGLTKIELPSTLKTLGKDVFKDCKNLKEIVIPNNCSNKTFPLFSGCSNLEYLKLPVSFFFDGEYKMNLGLYFGSLQYPNSTYILQTVLRKGVETNEGYYLPRNLKKIVITTGFQKKARICSSTFENCISLEEVELPFNLEAINKSAFENCTALKKINMPEGLQEIGSKAFYSCRNLLSVTIPLSVNSIGYKAFGAGTSPLIRRERPAKLPSGFNEEFCEKGSAVWNFKG